MIRTAGDVFMRGWVRVAGNSNCVFDLGASEIEREREFSSQTEKSVGFRRIFRGVAER